MDDVVVARADAGRIDRLKPLWMALHAQHISVDPALPGIPIRTQDSAWERRRRLYEGWLAEKDAFLLTAECRAETVGYALTHMHEADESWETHGRFAELESLAVLPRMRNRGVGRMLMSGVYEELRRLGVAVLEIGVLATNEAARRFYERQGFAPWVVHYLGRVPGAGR